MQVIRCPQCKYENIIKSADAGGCALCGEDLIRCNYCRHQLAGDGCGLVNGEEYYLPNGNGAKNCPYYSSIYQRRGIRVLQFIPAPVWVVIAIVFAFILLMATAYSVDPEMRHFRGNEILVDVKVVDNFTPGGDKALSLHVINPLRIKSTDVTLQIYGDFMTSSIVGKPEITNVPGLLPQKIIDDNGTLTMLLYPLAPESEYTIKIPFHSLSRGDKTLHMQIFAPRSVKVKDVDILIPE